MRAAGVALLISILAVATACSDGDPGAASPSPTSRVVPSFVPTVAPTVPVAPADADPVVTGAPSDTGAAAVIEGPLLLVDGCLVIDASEGGRGQVLFPFGTTWDAAAQAVVGPDGVRVLVGEVLSATGGAIPADAPARLQLADCAARLRTDQAYAISPFTTGT